MIQKNDIVLITKKVTDETVWREEMDAFVGNGVKYTVAGTMFGNHALIPEAGYAFPFASLEKVGHLEPVFDQTVEPIFINPTEEKRVFVRVGSDETYDTERAAMIDHYESELKALINFRGSFNMMTAIENADAISRLMEEIKYFDIANMEK